MKDCDQHGIKTVRYLDADLKGDELAEFRAHLEVCAECQTRLAEERALSNVLHRARPLYLAPAALRASVLAAVGEQSALTGGVARSNDRVLPTLGTRWLTAIQALSRLRVVVPATAAIALLLLLAPNLQRQVRAANFVETAVATHRSCVAGSLVPGVRTSSPELVSAWFAGKVPFDFRLPMAESAPENKPSYVLTGASLVNYKGDPAALVTYEAHDEKISLLVASDKSAVVAGGDEVRFGRLTFHYRTNADFKVITWSNHGLSYALVSRVSGSARESCLVCHQDMADHNTFSNH